VNNVNDFVNEMTGGLGADEYDYNPKTDFLMPDEIMQQTEEFYEEPQPKVKVISEGTKKSIKKGRPKKK
jgi:hypothetical protein